MMNESGTKQEIPMSFNLDDFYTTQEQRDRAEKIRRRAIRVLQKHGKTGESDRKHDDMKPKHLFMGKSSNGRHDWR